MEIYVTDFPNATRKWQVSRDGGSSPSWSTDGREIYFKGSDHLMAARVTYSGDGIEIGPPLQLGSIGANDQGPYASDGQHGVPSGAWPQAAELLVTLARWIVGTEPAGEYSYNFV